MEPGGNGQRKALYTTTGFAGGDYRSLTRSHFLPRFRHNFPNFLISQ